MRLPRDSNDANSEAGTQSFVSPSGVRYFIESYDDTQPPATYHLAPRSTLQSRFDSKCTGTLLKHFFESDGNRGVEFSSASFQAYKQRNEDRVFCHQFDGGLLFGIFDGHGGDILSEHASTSLPPLLAFSLSEALASEPNDAHDLKSTPDMGLHRAAAVEAALVNTFQQFDAALIEQVLALIPNKPLKEWTKDEAVQMMQLHKDIVRKAITGTTALVGYLAGNQRDLWIASLGDSEALARLESEFVALNELHNCKNPEEIERIKSEHPNEDGLVSPQGRILRALAITRAFGDMMFKVDPELSHYILKHSTPCFVSSSTISVWCAAHKTPPYISSTPSIRHYTINAGDILVLASDGLRDALQAQVKNSTINQQERARLFTTLAHCDDSEDLPSQLGTLLSDWEKRLGHGFLAKEYEKNSAKRVIENVLFGLDDRKMARELTMEFSQNTTMRSLQDDISVVVIKVLK